MHNPAPALLKPAAVAALFGVTTRTVRNWQRRKLLTPVRMGSSVFFRRAEVEALAGCAGDADADIGCDGGAGALAASSNKEYTDPLNQ